MLIRNIVVYDPVESQIKNVYISKQGQIEILDLKTDLTILDILQVIDVEKNHILMPGMLDTHIHGQGGIDFIDVGQAPESIPVITSLLGQQGLAYVMATLVSSDLHVLQSSLQALDKYIVAQESQPTNGATKIVGVHLEGPFIAKNCKGAHDISCLQSSINVEIFKNIISVAPHITQWKITIAPELPGGIEFIKQVKALAEEGISVKVFIGHCNPDKSFIDEAIAAGAAGFTHLGNACQETCSRCTRALTKADATSHIVQWVLDHAEQCPPGVELIVDGVHLSQAFVKLIHTKIGNKVVLVTDALGPTGLEDGDYKLGSLPVRKVKDSFYVLNKLGGEFLMKENGDKTLAGSAAALSRCIENYTQWIADTATQSAQMHAIYAAVIANPRTSSLSEDTIAKLPDNRNFIILDKDGRLVMSLCNGVVRHHATTVPAHVAKALLTQTFFGVEQSKFDVITTSQEFFHLRSLSLRHD